jgi:hypothetical protein
VVTRSLSPSDAGGEESRFCSPKLFPTCRKSIS